MDVAGRKDFKSSRAKTASTGQPPTKKGKRVRVVIADDNPAILEQISLLIETRFDVVGRVHNGRELMEAVQRLSPSVVVADITMPEMDGIEAARRITQTYPGVKVVILSVHSESAFIDAAFQAGASGYVTKSRAFTELIPAIEAVLAGRQYCQRGLR